MLFQEFKGLADYINMGGIFLEDGTSVVARAAAVEKPSLCITMVCRCPTLPDATHRQAIASSEYIIFTNVQHTALFVAVRRRACMQR